MVANALREASNLERFDEQTYTMMVNIGKNVVYHMHKFVGGLDMNDFGTENSPGNLDLMKAKVTDERKGLFWAGHRIWSELCKKHILHTDRKSAPK
jgi:hypothetical protein